MAKNKKVFYKKGQAVDYKFLPVNEKPVRYLQKHPIWSFARCDQGHNRWAIKNCISFYEDIIKKLIAYEGLTWGEIQVASGGKSVGHGTNSHFENISDLCKEAQERAEEIHLMEDQLFSLRLSARERLYGILTDGVFSIIWYDAEHEICPTRK